MRWNLGVHNSSRHRLLPRALATAITNWLRNARVLLRIWTRRLHSSRQSSRRRRHVFLSSSRGPQLLVRCPRRRNPNGALSDRLGAVSRRALAPSPLRRLHRRLRLCAPPAPDRRTNTTAAIRTFSTSDTGNRGRWRERVRGHRHQLLLSSSSEPRRPQSGPVSVRSAPARCSDRLRFVLGEMFRRRTLPEIRPRLFYSELLDNYRSIRRIK